MDVSTLRKDEIVRRASFKCRHGHTGLSHAKCYERGESAPVEVVGFADIEASNLNATFGIIYTYCIKTLDGPLIKRAIQLEDLHRGVFDRELVRQFIEDTKKFDRLIFHYGNDRRFDLPFLRTRAEYWRLDFPGWKDLYVSDSYPILRNKFRLHSNRLETACQFFGIPAKEHKLNPDIWLEMVTGNPKKMKHALDYILKHNIEDVESLEALWKRINRYSKVGKTSI